MSGNCPATQPMIWWADATASGFRQYCGTAFPSTNSGSGKWEEGFLEAASPIMSRYTSASGVTVLTVHLGGPAALGQIAHLAPVHKAAIVFFSHGGNLLVRLSGKRGATLRNRTDRAGDVAAGGSRTVMLSVEAQQVRILQTRAPCDSGMRFTRTQVCHHAAPTAARARGR
ncbi:hypothetical protein EYF80_047038 [Liparis tanakae]|uniref:Uncharacterized protein n=1 Tax=Liparis tanakae TaxID=230148 RepID=A0A4Z2FNS7_9TELE|nr:hypothetical protein EYF80_047038 [Liparis tanakae]